MSSHFEAIAGQEIKGRVLFTGNGTRVIDDLMRRVGEANQVEKCPPTEQNFKESLASFDPHAVVICLSYESRETVRMFTELRDDPAYAALPLIAIGNEVDCGIFGENVQHEQVSIFPRPLDMELYSMTLDQILQSGVAQARRLRVEELEAEAAEAARKEAEEADGMSESALLRAEEALVKKIQKMTRLYGRKTILVVDDDVRMLNVIKLYLVDLYDVVVVPSGALALKYLSKKHADLVLLDYMMPEEDGPTVLQQIRENSPQPSIPVLFLTGVSDKELVMRGLEFRPMGYLLKPVTREILLEKVTEIVLGLL